MSDRVGLADCQTAINWLAQTYCPAKPAPQRASRYESNGRSRCAIIERARLYIRTIEPAVSGERGHDATYRVACILMKGFGLSVDEAYQLLVEYSARCIPPWSERELMHKLEDAAKEPGTVGYLLDAESRSVGGRAEAKAADGGAIEPPRFTRLVTSKELVKLDLRPRFIVEGVMVAGQQMVTGGLSKVLKTSIDIDLLLSLATGTPFLGRFPTEQQQVAFWSGESGAATIRETAIRIAKSKGLALDDCPVHWGFDLPQLSNAEHLEYMADMIQSLGLNVVAVDPLYLCLLDASTARQANNVFAMGSLLRPLTELAQRLSVTLLLVHHFRKTGQPSPDEPAPLDELSQSGVAEWARQWLLLQRRSPYQADGRHELFMRVGGSAGHAGLYAVDVAEGVFDVELPDGGRYWDVEVRSVGDIRVDAAAVKAAKKSAEALQRVEEVYRDILDAFRHFPGNTATKTRVRERVGRTRVFDQAWLKACNSGELEECQVSGANGQKYEGFRRVYKPNH